MQKYGPGDADYFQYSDRGYTLMLPNNSTELIGTVLLLDDVKIDLHDSTRQQFIHIASEANAKGLAVLYIATGIPVDFYFSRTSLQYVDSLLHEVMIAHSLPQRNVFLLGAMVSGFRALKYAEYCAAGQSSWRPPLAGLVMCESSIDMVRQWYECQKQVRDGLTPTQIFEGHFISYLFGKYLGAPSDNIRAYIDFSPYTYFDPEMKKSKLYKKLAVRAYTYADTKYWFSAPGHGVFDSNYPDMSGFINEQKLVGNPNAELIVFHSNDQDPPGHDMRRQSSTWDLVNQPELVDWIVRQAK
jgi:hypothetical protein